MAHSGKKLRRYSQKIEMFKMKLHDQKITSGRFSPLLPCQNTSPDNTFFCSHTGRSMNPTINSQDLLEIKPYHKKKPREGDVILFQSQRYDNYVVHRIVSITANGIQTWGDNISYTDPELLKQEDIYGQVIAAHRGNKRRKIASGYFGRVVGKYCQLRRLALFQVLRFLRPVYRSFCTGGILHWLIPVRLKPQVATFQSNAYACHRLLLGKRIIGSYDDSLHRWQIRRPYRLFVDESSLPIL